MIMADHASGRIGAGYSRSRLGLIGRKGDLAEYEAICMRVELHGFHCLETVLRGVPVEREDELRVAPEQHCKQFLDTAHVLRGDGLIQRLESEFACRRGFRKTESQTEPHHRQYTHPLLRSQNSCQTSSSPDSTWRSGGCFARGVGSFLPRKGRFAARRSTADAAALEPAVGSIGAATVP